MEGYKPLFHLLTSAELQHRNLSSEKESDYEELTLGPPVHHQNSIIFSLVLSRSYKRLEPLPIALIYRRLSEYIRFSTFLYWKNTIKKYSSRKKSVSTSSPHNTSQKMSKSHLFGNGIITIPQNLKKTISTLLHSTKSIKLTCLVT